MEGGQAALSKGSVFKIGKKPYFVLLLLYIITLQHKARMEADIFCLGIIENIRNNIGGGSMPLFLNVFGILLFVSCDFLEF